jgi:TatD DNase family protein
VTCESSLSAGRSCSAGRSLSTWIDTHAHLDDHRFDSDLESVLDRAREAGVQSIVTIGVDLSSSWAAVALAERYEGVYAAVGVQPNAAAQVGAHGANESTYGELRELLKHPRTIAVGEIGLDYYWDQSPRDVQQAVLEAQLGLAEDESKPVVIHIRDKRDQTGAYDDALAILRNWVSGLSIRQSVDSAIAPSPGVLHCFSGSAEIAQDALALGFYLGVDGPVTYPNASARPLQALVAELPLDRILLETDCPYLAPQARRGKRNEPAYLPFVGVKVAELKGIQVADLAQATAANAQRLFHLEPWE